MPPFIVCLHDASPRYADETRTILRALAPLVGGNMSIAVVPDWDGRWPLRDHPEYCRLLAESSDELLLHGYRHRRRNGWGAVSMLAERSDEMNGLNEAETLSLLKSAQREFAEAFGKTSVGFLAPAWQRAGVSTALADASNFQFILGYFAIHFIHQSQIPLSTFTWDCGRWRALGHLGHSLGAVRLAFDSGIPVLAIHPRDIGRGFWPYIRDVTASLLNSGYTPATIMSLASARSAEVSV